LQNLRADQATVNKAYEQQMKVQKSLPVPAGWDRVKEWFQGISYVHFAAPEAGVVKNTHLTKWLIFNIKQSIWLGNPNDESPGTEYTIWFPPDLGSRTLIIVAAFFVAAFITRGRMW